MGNEGEITASSKPAKTTYTGYVGAQTGFTNFERIGQRNDNAFIFGGEVEHTLAEDYLGEKSTIKGSVDCAVGSNLRAKTALSYNYLGRNGLKATAGLSVEYLKESKPSLFTSTGPENTGNCYYQYEINVPVPDGCTAYKTLNYTDDSHNSFWLPNNYPFEAVHDSVSFRKEYNIDIPPTSQETKFKAGRFSTELNVGLGYVEPKKKI